MCSTGTFGITFLKVLLEQMVLWLEVRQPFTSKPSKMRRLKCLKSRDSSDAIQRVTEISNPQIVKISPPL